MPQSTFDPPTRSTATLHRRDPHAEAARREALLEASMSIWLQAAGWDRSATRAAVDAHAGWLQAWLRDTAPAQRVERLAGLADDLARRLAPCATSPAANFLAAFARAMLATAVAEVEREAARAGHGGWFTSLRPFMHRDPDAAQRAELAAQFDAAGHTLDRALSRLRHRLHQRIEAALAAWAQDRAVRDALRRRLRDSLTGKESSP